MSQSRTSKVIALSSGKALSTGVILLTGVVLSRILSLEEYATFRQAVLSYMFVAPFLGLGLGQALYYFLPGDEQRMQSRIVDALLLLLGMGVLFMLFILAGGNTLLAQRFHNPLLAKALLLLAPYGLFALPRNLLAPVLVIRGKITQLNSYNVIFYILLGIATLIPCFVWKQAVYSLLGHIIITGVACVPAVWMVFHYTPSQLNRSPSWRRMLEMLRFSIPLGAASMIAKFNVDLDKMIVSSMCHPADFAVYANGAIQIPLIEILTASIFQVIVPEMREKVTQGRHSEALGIFRQGSERSAAILLPVMWLLLIIADDLMVLLFSNKYSGSAIVFRIYLLLLPVRIVQWGGTFTALGMPNAILGRTIVRGVGNGILTFILIQWLGMLGAAWATVLIVYLISVPWNLLGLRKGFHESIDNLLPWKQIAFLLVGGMFAAALTWSILLVLVPQKISTFQHLLHLGLAVCLFLLIYALICGHYYKTSIFPVVSFVELFKNKRKINL